MRTAGGPTSIREQKGGALSRSQHLQLLAARQTCTIRARVLQKITHHLTPKTCRVPLAASSKLTRRTPTRAYARIEVLTKERNPGRRLTNLPTEMPKLPDGVAVFTWEACAVFLGWIAYTTFLHLFLPGIRQEGVVLADSTRLSYKLNGMRCFTVTLTLVACGVHTGRLNLGWVHENFLALLTAGVIFSYGMSVCLYVGSFAGDKLLAKGGDTGRALAGALAALLPRKKP